MRMLLSASPADLFLFTMALIGSVLSVIATVDNFTPYMGEYRELKRMIASTTTYVNACMLEYRIDAFYDRHIQKYPVAIRRLAQRLTKMVEQRQLLLQNVS